MSHEPLRNSTIDAFLSTYRGMSRDELFAMQDAQFRKVLAFAWKTGFYRRLWGRAGIEPGDVRGLINGGHYIREAMSHWIGAQFISAGTGIETRETPIRPIDERKP